ncbi:MAG: tetratricopeptide repeat protein [Verrucomicrobia bacterium]|nr:tetratricopeptide repeat protein [Verrucomicrobiota bacterium]
MRPRCCPIFLIILSLAWAFELTGAESQIDNLLKQARSAFDNGNREEAVALAQKAIEQDPKNPQGYALRGRMHDAMRQYEKAILDYDTVLKLNRQEKQIYQLRGSAHFKLGHIQQSIADFDRFIQLDPSQAPHHWQRGIAYYHAGRYEDGRKQFELHQTVNSNDVENAVWHFLCVARGDSIKKARERLIPIQGDRRVPMMTIYALFAGQASAEDVLAAAKAGEPSPEELKQRLFYAHLYLGLYYEASGNNKLAKEHIVKAAEDFKVEHYMGDVARVHAKLRWEEWMKQ